MNRGFTFVEALIGTAIFLAVVFGIYEAYRALYISISASYAKVAALNLITERFEIARSIPYESVVSASETAVVDGTSFDISTTVLDQGGYKLIDISVACASCRNFTPIFVTGRLAP